MAGLWLLVPIPVGAAALLDDLVEGRAPVWIDIVIAAGLGAVTLAIVAVAFRMHKGRSQYRRVAAQGEEMLAATAALGDPEHSGQVLSQICQHACAILRVNRAAIFARHEDDPRAYSALAGHGVPEDLIGQPLPGDKGMAGRVLASGEPLLLSDYQRFADPMPHRVTEDMHGGASAPIRWDGEVRGALAAATTDPERKLDQSDLEMLCRLADLAGLAFEQLSSRQRAERALAGGAEGLAVAVDLRDSYTAEHSEEVVELAVAVGRRLGMEGDELRELELGARLHDIGKIGIPDEILRKRDPLDAEQWEEMKRHPVFGERVLARIPGFEGIARIVRFEHERWDGTGYPDGLAAEQIPLASRIILACDAYHAMTSNRPYRRAMSGGEARAELRAGRGSQFDPRVVDTLLGVLKRKRARAFS